MQKLIHFLSRKIGAIKNRYYLARRKLGQRIASVDKSWLGWNPVYNLNENFKWKLMLPDSSIPEQHPGRFPLRSEMCTEYHFYLDMYRYWVHMIKEIPRFHRKQWEFVYIMQSLWERGLLVEGKRGVGFGVGREPLVSYFSSMGNDILATDLDLEKATHAGWTASNQRTKTLEGLNERQICPDELFKQKVTFQDVDMNAIPDNIREYDFCWSACCFEHLGSIELGKQFVLNSINTLKPGGWAIHTTELNLTSNTHTIDNSCTVLFRKKDLEDILTTAKKQGHYIEPLILNNSCVVDQFVDLPPYRAEPHLRMQLGEYVTTSVGLIIRKKI